MHDLTKALLQINSLDFQVNYGVISGLGLLKRSLFEDVDVQVALLACQVPSARVVTLVWALHLVGRPVNPRYAHPDDAALAAYLIILQDWPEATLLAAGILKLACAGHWSRALAMEVFYADRS